MRSYAMVLQVADDVKTINLHHNLTCYLRQSVERRRINVTGLNCTTFLKAHPTKYQADNTLTLSAVATVLCALQKRKPSIELGFVKMGDRKLVEQPTAILLMS